MNQNGLNTEESYKPYTHTKILKESLHFKFVKYIDLFCILWLILHKKLKIINFKSYKILINCLNEVCNIKLEKSEEYRSLILDYINNSSFKGIIVRFITNLESKFNFNTRCHNKLESLSYDDFEICNAVLGRQPFGLYSVIKKCMCAFKFSDEQKIDLKSCLENLSEKWKEYRIFECTKRSNADNKYPLVAVVSPFVLSNHEGYLNSDNIQKKRKMCEDKDCDSFELNQKLYSSKFNYPLESIVAGSERWYEREEDHQSNRLSDILFELECLILEGKADSDISPEVYSLASIIKDNIVVDTFDNNELGGYSDEVFEVNVTDRLVRSYEQILFKVSEFKPFPTTYWLIDRSLITRISKLESDGMIKVIQNYIDERIENYDKGGNDEDFVRYLIEDNLSYMIRRYQLIHPSLIELLYNIIFNSNIFSTDVEEGILSSQFNYVRLDGSGLKSKKTQEENLLYKGLSILNTLRIHGIAGSKDFLHIKCLHTNLAYEIAEGSYIGSLISKLI